MEYAFIPTLENCAITKFATLLWNQSDIRYQVKEHFSRVCLSHNKRRERWYIIVEAVEDKARRLPLSEEQEDKLLSIIEPLGQEIRAWMEYHVQNEYLGVELPYRFFWTSQRRIDNKKTAEAIMNQQLDLNKIYKIACVYCLQYYIPMAWNKISEERKRYIWGERVPTVFGQQELVNIWTCEVAGDERKLARKKREIVRQGRSPLQYAFECAALAANKTATEFFLKRLNVIQKRESIARCMTELRDCLSSPGKELPEEYYIDVLCFLFSELDDRDKRSFLIDNSFDFLEFFLAWPRQPLFLETVNLVWDCLPNEAYRFLFTLFRSRFCVDDRDYDYQTLFEDFWRQTPPRYKRFIADTCTENAPFFMSLFNRQNRQMLKLTLRGLSPLQREQIICAQKESCERLIRSDNLDLFELLIQECISSNDAMINFKEYIFLRRPDETTRSPVWSRALQLLDEYVQRLE